MSVSRRNNPRVLTHRTASCCLAKVSEIARLTKSNTELQEVNGARQTVQAYIHTSRHTIQAYIHTHLEAASSSSQRMAKSGRDCARASRAPTYVTVVTQAHGRGLPVSGSPQCSHSSWKLRFGDGVERASRLEGLGR